MSARIAVLGGGSWGATLAKQLADNGHAVAVWEFDKATAEKLREERTLRTLPQLRLPDSIVVTNDMAEALKGRSIVLSVTPSHTVRGTFELAARKRLIEPGALVISATKGIEDGTFATMSHIVRETFPAAGDIVILSGPSHAEEVATGQPVALVAGCATRTAAERVRDLFASDTFRVYTSGDPLGVELGGSLKNVYAVACGVVDGLRFGDNTKAALMTRGLNEMTRLGSALGASSLTFFGLSGLGDMIVTCTSRHSRNRSLGEKIGSGRTLQQALSEMTMVAEGVNTARAAHHLSRKAGVVMPIVNEMHQILFEEKSPKDSIRDLLARQTGAEMEGIVV